MNGQEISVSRITEILKMHLETPGAPVPMLHGQPGISKSAQIRDLAKSKNFLFTDVRIASMSPMDILGLPVIDHEAQATTWFRPEFLPSLESIAKAKAAGYRGQLIVFEELTSAPPAIQASAYQILLDRQTGSYIMPEDPDFPIFMVAAGNLLGDKAVVAAMSTALKNRLSHFIVKPDVTSFIEYGLHHGFNHAILSYLKSAPQNLHVMPTHNTQYAFPTPRTWDFLSRFLNEHGWSELMETIAEGIIGRAAAGEFSAHMRVVDKLPDLLEIINKGHGTFTIPNDQMSLKWAYAIGLSSVITGLGVKVTQAQISNYVKALSILPAEFMALAFKLTDAGASFKAAGLLTRNKDYIAAIQKNLKIFSNAEV